MWVWVEPILGWVIAAIGACMVAIAVMFGKRLATWLGKVIGSGIVDALREHWTKDMTNQLEPLFTELQIGVGAEKWPNGSDTLPATMQTIYDRQAETYGMVRDIQKQLEAVLIDRPLEAPRVRAELDTDDVDGAPI